MKARAVVLHEPQMPFTIFGMPVLAIALVAVVAVIAGVVVMMVGLGSFIMFVMLGVLIPGLIWAYRIRRREPHIETVFLTCWQFWQGKSFRTFLAGPKEETHV